MAFQRQLTVLVGMLLIIGTCGFILVERWSILDAAYMTLITLSTVGFGEVHQLSPRGRAFTSLLVASSFVLMACWTASLTSQLVSGEISGRFRMQREKRMIKAMKDHTVVCGGGQLARAILGRLSGAGQQAIAIVFDPKAADVIRQTNPDVLVIESDEKSELAMIDANVLKAANLVAATDSDMDNLLITITGKGLGTNLRIFSCSQSPEFASRMIKVGADEVICPAIIGGERVATLIGEDARPAPALML